MKGIPQARYMREFREEAVRMVTDGGMSVPEAAGRLSLPPSTLRHLVKVHCDGKLGDIGNTRRPLTDIEMAIGDEFNASSRYWQEAFNGVVMRMTLLALVLGAIE